MSFYSDASLVMIPSGYKTSKVYSAVPTDGAGDLSFTRTADTATRVNSAGLIEKVRTNLLTYSNTFNNAAWVNSNITLTSGQQDPFGGTTGWRYLMTSVGNSYLYYNSITINGAEMTLSFWVKSNTGSSQTFIATANSGSQSSPTFTATTSWQRFSWTFTSSAGNSNVLLAYNASTNCDLLIYGAQFETGVMTDYIATTSAAVSVGPVANVPRLDYLNSSCPRLLLEPQRTNLVTYSEQLNQWDGSNVTITANTSQSPDGYQNADNVNITATNGYWRRSPLTFASSTSYAASVFVKKSATTGTKTFKFYYNNNSLAPINGEWKCVVDLTNITATTTTAGTDVTGKPTILSAKLVDYGNDWYRVEVAFTIGSGAGNSSSEIGFEANGVAVDFDAYGAQLEAGAYATSYIPTLGAAVTRGADAMTLSALNNADMTFTAFLELDEPSIGGTASDWFNVRNASALGRAFGYSNVFGFADNYNTSALSKTKMLWKQESGTTAKIFGDGALLGTSTTGTYSTPFTILEFYGASLLKPVRIKQFIFFANNITDAQCIELTTL